MADMLRRVRGISLNYALCYVISPMFDPGLLSSPLWIACALITAVVSVPAEYYAWTYADAPVVPESCLRWMLRVSVIRPLALGILVASNVFNHGVDMIRLVGVATLLAFSIGAILVCRPNLKVARITLFCYLTPPFIAGLATRTELGLSLSVVVGVMLIYNLRQVSLENKLYWEMLHVERSVRVRQQIEAQNLRDEALVLAERSKQVAVSAERGRIAAEWHDSLLADLSAASLQMESALRRLKRGQPADSAIELAIETIRQCKSQSRLMISDMFSDIGIDSDLQQSIEKIIRPALVRSNAELTWKINGESPPLLSPVETHQIIRISEEAVSNSLRHGRATRIEMELHNGADEFRVAIADNGIGFEPGKLAPSHFGLQILRARAQRLSGVVDINSRPGNGTVVTLRIPRRGLTMNPIRILVVDDHFLTKLAIKTLFDEDSNLKIVGEAANCAEAIRLFDELLPDITILDIRLPDGSGIGALKEIHAKHPHAKVIVMSNLHGSEHIARALSEGAMAYLGKDAPAEEILSAIRTVHQGQQFLSASAARSLGHRPLQHDLTPREQDVLELLVKGLSNRSIGDQLGISEKTVRAHMTNVLSKLQAKDRTQAAMIAIQRGFVES